MFNCKNILLKFIISFLAFEQSLGLKLNSNPVNITEMTSYLQHIHREFSYNTTSQLTVVQSVRHKRVKYYFNELLSEYLKTISGIKIKLENVYRYYRHEFAYFNVIFIDSYESFL